MRNFTNIFKAIHSWFIMLFFLGIDSFNVDKESQNKFNRL